MAEEDEEEEVLEDGMGGLMGERTTNSSKVFINLNSEEGNLKYPDISSFGKMSARLIVKSRALLSKKKFLPHRTFLKKGRINQNWRARILSTRIGAHEIPPEG